METRRRKRHSDPRDDPRKRSYRLQQDQNFAALWDADIPEDAESVSELLSRRKVRDFYDFEDEEAKEGGTRIPLGSLSRDLFEEYQGALVVLAQEMNKGNGVRNDDGNRSIRLPAGHRHRDVELPLAVDASALPDPPTLLLGDRETDALMRSSAYNRVENATVPALLRVETGDFTLTTIREFAHASVGPAKSGRAWVESRSNGRSVLVVRMDERDFLHVAIVFSDVAENENENKSESAGKPETRPMRLLGRVYFTCGCAIE